MDVVVTGMGVVCALGVGRDALWHGIAAGTSGLAPMERFAAQGFGELPGGLVPGFEALPAGERSLEFARLAAQEAGAQAGLAAEPALRARAALVLGASVTSARGEPHTLTAQLGERLGVHGPRLTVSTACASSTAAIGLACDLLDSGEVELVLAGGADDLTADLVAGFHALGVTGSACCAPFSVPEGMSLGEGAGFLVLERGQHARSRSAPILAALLGYGLSGDAHHETSPDPWGRGVARAWSAALADAGVRAEQVGYVNAHGTGTAANDTAEWRAAEAIFGAGTRVPISSTKAHLGHAQGAAGVLEVVTTLLCMQHGTIPPTLNFSRPRPLAPVDPVGQALPRPARYEAALCTNSAFGGQNAALVVAPSSARGRAREPHGVLATAVATVRHSGAQSPARCGVESLEAWLAEVIEDLLRDRVPRADPRRLDLCAALLTGASGAALDLARVRARGALRDHAGLFIGTRRVSPDAWLRFDHSIRTRGYAGVSTTAFARMVLNAAQGSTSQLLSLRGPQATLSVESGGGLTAVVCAARHLAMHDDADLIVAGAVDAQMLGTDEAPTFVGEASCLTLLRDGCASLESGVATVRVAGWATDAPGRCAQAVTRALARSGLAAASVEAVYGSLSADIAGLDGASRHPARIEASGAPASLEACGAALEAISRGTLRAALVVEEGEHSMSNALVLTASGVR